MATAIDMYLNQIFLTGGIPFSITLPKAPASIYADAMTTEDIHQKLGKGYNEALTDMKQLYNYIAYVLQAAVILTLRRMYIHF